MLITYIRSSSYSNWDYCQMQYYMNYVLGLPRGSNKKADQGTIVHKVMEILANCKHTMQDEQTPRELRGSGSQSFLFDDEHIGLVKWDEDDFLKPTALTNDEVTAINKTRINKYKYKHDAKLKYGAVHYGVDMVEGIFERAYAYYCGDDWAPVDKKDCRNWTWMAMEYKEGIFDPRKRTIHAAEPHFDFVIDKPWAQYDWMLPSGEKISGKLAVKGTIDLITMLDDGILEIVDWKGLPISTAIPTPDGWSTMGDLKIGDVVFDENGQSTKVIGKSQVKTKPCYNITFDDTTEVVCDDEHLWKLRDGNTLVVTDLSIGDKINITKPLETEDIELPIDPYVLGIWLGDGRNRTGEVCGVDQFIFEEIINRSYKLGNDIGGKDRCSSHTIYGLRTILRQLNLLNNKHIPPIYLRASIGQRMDLLRGLMDSDGNVNSIRKQAVFTSCNKRLSDDTKELLISLGQRPNQGFIDKKYKDGIVKVYPLHFRPIDINPFLLPRKANQIDPNWGSGQSSYRRIVSIDLIDEQQTQCIMVDSDEHTYLCTDNMIPTHNTGQRIDWGCKTKNNEKTYAKLCLDFQLLLYYYASKQLYPDVKQIIVSIMFVRDGGPFTMCLDDQTISEVEERLRKRFQEISACQLPMMQDASQRDFRCTRICDYYNMVAPNGENMCKFIRKEIEDKGIAEVTKRYTQEGFSVGIYQAPGEK